MSTLKSIYSETSAFSKASFHFSCQVSRNIHFWPEVRVELKLISQEKPKIVFENILLLLRIHWLYNGNHQLLGENCLKTEKFKFSAHWISLQGKSLHFANGTKNFALFEHTIIVQMYQILSGSAFAYLRKRIEKCMFMLYLNLVKFLGSPGKSKLLYWTCN